MMAPIKTPLCNVTSEIGHDNENLSYCNHQGKTWAPASVSRSMYTFYHEEARGNSWNGTPLINNRKLRADKTKKKGTLQQAFHWHLEPSQLLRVRIKERTPGDSSWNELRHKPKWLIYATSSIYYNIGFHHIKTWEQINNAQLSQTLQKIQFLQVQMPGT